MLKRILVGLGGTEYTISAIRQAVALAQVHDAQVTGVSVLDETRLRWTGQFCSARFLRMASDMVFHANLLLHGGSRW